MTPAYIPRLRRSFAGHSRQSGAALLIVLWACTLAAIVLGGFAMTAKVEALQAGAQRDKTVAHYAALAGVDRAVYAFRVADVTQRWIGDGRVYRMQVGQAEVQVSVEDNDGKINLNAADPILLERLFETAGVDSAQSHSLVAAIQAWRMRGDTPAPVTGAGQALVTPLGGFASIEELQSVPGMEPKIYDALEPALTLWSVGSTPYPAHASALVLSASTDMTLQQTSEFVERRRQASSLEYGMPALPNGVQVLGGGGSGVLSMDSTAVMPDGIRSRLRVTLQIHAQVGDNRAYRILRWQEDG
jgi:general secretion pathway protein K